MQLPEAGSADPTHQSNAVLADVLIGAEASLRDSAADAAVVLRVRSTDMQVHVRVSGAALLEAVKTLMETAIRTTAPGGTVSVEAQEVGEDVMLWIRDEGAAAADVVEATAVRARASLNADSGTLWSESMPPLGTTYVLRLPLSR